MNRCFYGLGYSYFVGYAPITPSDGIAGDEPRETCYPLAFVYILPYISLLSLDSIRTYVGMGTPVVSTAPIRTMDDGSHPYDVST